jgi:integrase
MTYDERRRKYVVRWRENGRRRIKRFDTPDEAEVFERGLQPASVAAESRSPEVAALAARLAELEAQLAATAEQAEATGDGVLPYETKAGTRYGFKFRQSDGTSSTRRGYVSKTAARKAKRKLEESIDRGEIKVARESFEAFWNRLLAERKPYLTKGGYQDMETHGRLRLLPFLGSKRLSAFDEDLIRLWMAEMIKLLESDDPKKKLSPKTINNSRGWLSVALGEAVRRKLLPQNPCEWVKPLPVDKVEIDYLRLAEIDRYLETTPDYYRALAEFLIGTGARISEAVRVRWTDLELDHAVVRIYRQRERRADGDAPTKGKRFRPVLIGPGLVQTLRDLRARREEHGIDDGGWVFLCPPVKRGRYANRTEPVPPAPNTVHEWHEAALEDAGLRDMPLHCLRHTAAAAWLATGHELIFVQRQLGHASITTTEEHYVHLEVKFMADAAARTEAAIRKAGGLVPAAA